MLLPLPYVQPNGAFFFREKACACSTTRIARLVRTRRKKNAERGKSAKQTCTSGSPFFCLLFFGEAKKSKCPVGMRRMVKTTPNANHKAVTQSVICSTTHISAQTNFSDPKLHFRLPTPYPSTPKELPHLLPHSTNTQAPTFALRYALFPQTN